MTQVVVSRLRIRSPPDLSARARHRVEDALRVAPAAPERLLVVRRLALGRIAADARAERWHARTADALAEQRARAVHGAHPGAADAGAVWFRSESEARALLLRELAAGRRPRAWFWRLAVPGWDEATLDAWLPRLIAAADRDPQAAVALARAVIEAAEAGLLPAIVAALPSGLPGIARKPPIAPRAASGPSTTEVDAGAGGLAETPGASAAAVLVARRTLLALPAMARLAFGAAFVAHSRAPQVAAWLARIVLLGTTPEAAASPAAIEAAVGAVILESLRTSLPEPPPTRPSPRSSLAEADAPTAPARPAPTPEVERIVDRRAQTPDEASAEPHREAATTTPEPVAPEAEIGESTSAYAGLLLLIRPLDRLGLAEWLERRPEALAGGFARRLLHAIGVRMGAPDDDPALAALAAPKDGGWADEITAWRVGLDRWLRRTARLKVADVVRRRGGLLLAGDRLDVRFRLADADIRLRRHALDLDPLWTPWLGLSVRYHFREQPLQ